MQLKAQARNLFIGVPILLVMSLLVWMPFGRTPYDKRIGTIPKLSKGADLIANENWSDYPGASQDARGVHVFNVGRAIVNQDGTKNQENKPVNASGPHAEIVGDFAVTAQVEGVNDTAPVEVAFYSAVPIIYDEWRYETPSITVTAYVNKVSVAVHDGAADSPKVTKDYAVKLGASAQIGLKRQGSTIYVVADGKDVSAIEGGSVYPNETELWFGTYAFGKGWLLSGLKVVPEGKGTVTLKGSLVDTTELFAGKRYQTPFGSAVSLAPLMTDTKYRELVLNNLSMITPENEMKAQFIHPQPGAYSFQEADALVRFAQNHSMKVHGHALVFGEANPQWMQDTALKDRQAVMVDHIEQIVRHYGDKVPEWDVINEPFDDEGKGLRNHIWYQAMGESYIPLAFESARAASADAKLFINEYGLEADGEKWTNFLALIDRLQAGNVPIDGVGFQAHVHDEADAIDRVVLTRHFAELVARGLEVRVSEIDVLGGDAEFQADQYKIAYEVCKAMPNCTSYSTWGLTDKYGSTTEAHVYPLSYGDDLLFDENLRPKAAYKTLSKILN